MGFISLVGGEMKKLRLVFKSARVLMSAGCLNREDTKDAKEFLREF
jgi:hypothetical protein